MADNIVPLRLVAPDEVPESPEAEPYGLTTDIFDTLMAGQVCSGFIAIGTDLNGGIHFIDNGLTTIETLGVLESVKAIITGRQLHGTYTT